MRDIDVFHINDLHRHLSPLPDGRGGVSRLSSLAREQLASHPDSVLVSVGDVAGDGSVQSPRAFDPIPGIFNRMGVDILALGNHEFEDPSNGYETLRKGLIKELDADTICANVGDEKSGRRIDGTAPYTMRTLAGINVAFIGVVTRDLSNSMFPTAGAGLRAARIDKVLARMVPRVRAEGADAVVVLMHDSISESKTIARDVPGIDVILAAHDHLPTPTPLCIEREDGARTWIAEAGAYGTALGHVRLQVDEESRRVVGVEGRQLPVTAEIAPDPEVAAIVDRWKPLPHAGPSVKRRWRTVTLEQLKETFEK